MYALARSGNDSNEFIWHGNVTDSLVCASGLDGCNDIDSFQASIASSYSSVSNVIEMSSLYILGRTKMVVGYAEIKQ
jgi:hypothetical protein